ncbi:hypothetical protein Bca52824_079751 [Brassica carinata]|uniref:CWZF3/5/7 THD domain-containing protein n=1 Tax=Brassica carinata TaxID=52824 RepID=A0A8X7Q0S7_BRACI|nr:hypothetical protein Bca52824_079751 [Brassica carinata]
MISVSSSEIGLGFGGIEEEEDMEMEMEMEEDSDFEESTHSYVSCVDPDVALSYIDEKLENVLGHFQKDFEGGVSAENLGAKYGGYGSFLSMYQRSPVCKSPPQVQNQVVASAVPPQVSVSGSTSKPPPASDVLAKLKNLVKSSNDSKQKPAPSPSPSSSAPSNHKTLKLRIKVGSKSDLSLKNGKQGLLNMQPSTSRVNCLSEVEEGLLNSPTKILMAMVSFPLHKDQLLSPLSDDLIQLGKKGNIMKDAKVCEGKVEVYATVKQSYSVMRGACFQDYEASSLSCLSPPSIHRAKEIDKISDSYVEGGMNNTVGLDAALMGSKPELEDNVVAFHDRSVEGEDVEEGEALKSPESKPKLEKAPGVEHVDYSSVVKVSKRETKNEEQTLKSKLPKAHKSQKNAAVNIINTNVPDRLQEDVGGSEDIGASGESKEREQEQSSLVPKAKKEKLSEESALKESFNSVRNVDEAWKCEPDSKHPIKSSELNKDGHNTKQSVRSEVKNKHSVEGGMKHVGMEPERELSGICKKPKTGKSRFSAVEHSGSNKTMKDFGKASPHEDRKRKHKENKESGDCMREDAVMASSGENVRKQKRLKGSSSESCDRDRGVSQENGRDSASHQPLTPSSPSLLCKDLGSEVNVQEAKGSLVDSLAPSALDQHELKSGRISERDKHHDIDTTAGTTKKAAESSKEGRSPAPLKENHRSTANEVQDLGATVEVKTKESRNKKRPARKVSMESNKEDSREHQDPINKLDTTTADQVEVLNHGREISSTKTKAMRNDNHDVGSRYPKQNGSSHNDHVGSSPLKKEITSQAASNSIKEATDLKHIADRLKNAGNNHESIGFYFQAALKFLHGASLLESSGTENATHKSIATSKHIYGSTAKLCKFCAYEYEKDKDMGAAALAYKCMEVAYLRITYSSHGNINRYKSELEASLQVIPSGESPSFASDGENPNKTLAAEKVALSTPVRSSPKVTGNHLSSGNHSSLSQLLTFSQNVSLAMDASRKAQTAFAVAKGKSCDTRYSSNGITSIKRALDFSFQDMEKLVHAVRLAMESINR